VVATARENVMLEFQEEMPPSYTVIRTDYSKYNIGSKMQSRPIFYLTCLSRNASKLDQHRPMATTRFRKVELTEYNP